MSNAGQLSCDNCGEGHGPDDIFCENCGYDFITGSLPSAEEDVPVAVVPEPALAPLDEPISSPPSEAPAPFEGGPDGGDGGDGNREASTAFLGTDSAAVAESAPAAPAGAGDVAMPTKLRFTIEPDKAYFEAIVSEGELEYPEPPPSGAVIDVNGIEFHIGRTSQSRAIHPDLDISDLTGDPAVSSRHAVVRVSADGSMSVTDVGSTNGTFVGDVDSKPIKVGEVVPVDESTPIFVGAWTRLEITKLDS